ncbi:hypothetical protein [Desulfosporosinus youngiae]|uniref:hypothetical protein n=1 Tax=Desulfosporosinus youngiae TaxID=339862 RepID=UPI00030A9F46|nr:hypothetical protein [Desulfosporosinus youngiae]
MRQAIVVGFHFLGWGNDDSHEVTVLFTSLYFSMIEKLRTVLPKDLIQAITISGSAPAIPYMGYNPKLSVNPINIDKYTQVFIDCWRRFLRPDQGNEDFVIFDGSFLFHRANDLIQNYNATDEMIAAHLKALLSAMAPYNPLLFYLSSRDVGARLIQARKGRGQATATDAQIASEVERKSRQMQI